MSTFLMKFGASLTRIIKVVVVVIFAEKALLEIVLGFFDLGKVPTGAYRVWLCRFWNLVGTYPFLIN